MGYDLRVVCRELSRVVRDLLVLNVDPSRIGDPEIAGETERDRLKALAGRFSREDLLRAFDLLTQLESEIRVAAQPRYNLEMALLKWIHLRKLTPIEDLIAGIEGGSASSRVGHQRPAPPASRPPVAPVKSSTAVSGTNTVASTDPPPAAGPASTTTPEAGLKARLLEEIKKTKAVFYNMIVAQAQKIDVTADRVTFTFSPLQRALHGTVEQNRAWLEGLAQRVAGQKLAIVVVQGEATVGPEAPGREAGNPTVGNGRAATVNGPDKNRQSALREQAMADTSVQALLEVFPAEIRDVEEM
jgi:DNA polymerase-3 subunit gamma/tau